MANPLDIIESKIRKVVEELQTVRKENERLKGECEMLKSQVTLTGGESRKAQQFLAEYERMKRTHEQATAKVERALQKISTLRLH